MTKIDPRGIMRMIIAVTECPEGGPTKLTLDCGHVEPFAQHFHYSTGNFTHCFKCGKEAREHETTATH